jgi:flagellar assembly factor FliW
VKINTSRFGELDVEQENILMFPNGILGFENCTKYSLFHEEKDQPMVFWLQSMDDPEVVFSVVDPAAFGLNFQISLTDDEAKLMEAQDTKDIAVMLMLYRPLMEAGDNLVLSAGVAANINGPLLINLSSKRGMQKLMLPGTGMVAPA